MKLITWFVSLAAVAALGVGTARPAFAQAAVTTADIQRLQDAAFDASRDIAQLRSRDAALATQLQREIDDARDEVIYLKVKLRKNEPVARSEYSSLRDTIDNIRQRAEGQAPAVPSAAAPTTGGRARTGAAGQPAEAPASRPASAAAAGRIPVGTEFDVRLQDALSSDTARPEDHFEATTLVDLTDQQGTVLVPAGSEMRGVVSSVDKATRTNRTGKLTVAFDRLTAHGRTYPIHATVTQALESEGIKGEAGKIGIGAGAGAILGAILGGAKGALAGILIGGGGTIAATPGKDVDLPPGTVLRVRLDSAVDLQR